MNTDRRLEPVKTGTAAQLAELPRARDVQTVQNVFDALSKLPPKQTDHRTFAAVGDVVLSLRVLVTAGMLGAASVGLNVALATEADLEESLSSCKSHDDRVYLRKMLALVRAETKAEPLEIRVINASELRTPDRLMTIKRDSEGKLAGATVQNAPE
jgi:hypothetical protein